jgi:hypothetical protein
VDREPPELEKRPSQGDVDKQHVFAPVITGPMPKKKLGMFPARFFYL